jgi:hypothetical protein
VRNSLVEVALGIPLSADDEKKELIVKAPSKPVATPERKAEKVVKKALEEERYSVLQIPKKVGKYIGLSSVGVGVSLFALLAYAGLTGQSNWIFLSSTSSFLIVGLWIAVGIVSVAVGFLLMGND